MAVVGCAVFAIACFCPMALFRLLAFVDPGTASGASFRTTLAANGGVSGLVSGQRMQDRGIGGGDPGRVGRPGGQRGRRRRRDGQPVPVACRQGIRRRGQGGRQGMDASAGSRPPVPRCRSTSWGRRASAIRATTTRRHRVGGQAATAAHACRPRATTEGGVGNDPARIASADEAAAVAEDGAMLA